MLCDCNDGKFDGFRDDFFLAIDGRDCLMGSKKTTPRSKEAREGTIQVAWIETDRPMLHL